MREQGHVARICSKGNVCKILVEKPEGKRPLGSRRHRWANNFRIDEAVGTGLIWLRLGTVKGSCQNGNELSDSVKR